MVRTVHVTGIASARTTAISIGAWLGRGRVAVLTRVRRLNYGSQALSIHPHRHAFSGHSVAIGSAAYNTNLALMVNAGALQASDVTGGTGATFPTSAGSIHHSNVTGIRAGATSTGFTIDSSGRYVAAGSHPAADHANLKLHGAAGPRIELGNVLRNNDILEITVLMQGETAGVF